MKHGKNPTVRQKKLMQAARLNCANWLVVKDLPNEMTIENRQMGKIRVIRKELYK